MAKCETHTEPLLVFSTNEVLSHFLLIALLSFCNGTHSITFPVPRCGNQGSEQKETFPKSHDRPVIVPLKLSTYTSNPINFSGSPCEWSRCRPISPSSVTFQARHCTNFQPMTMTNEVLLTAQTHTAEVDPVTEQWSFPVPMRTWNHLPCPGLAPSLTYFSCHPLLSPRGLAGSYFQRC